VSGSGGVQTLSVAVPNTFGQQRTLVILVNFQDNASQPYTPASAYATTLQTTAGFCAENSYGQTSLAGDVVGWFTIPMNSTACDTNQIATLADQAAASLGGVTLSAYSRKVYGFPQIGACTWWGLGSVGGNPSRAWVNGTYSLKVVAHELGHNFGNYLSHSQPCDTAGCSTVEYGDDRDVMGLSATGHMTAFQKERLGWLNYGISPPIQTVGVSNSYWVDGYAPMGTAPKALKVLKSADAAGSKTWYYIDARTRVGFDATIAPGVLVHTGASSAASLAVTPPASGGAVKGAYDISVSARAAGQAVAGASVTVTLTGPTGTTTTLSAVTSTAGAATVKFRPKRTDPLGVYQVRADVSGGGLTGSGTGTLTVK